MRRVLQNFFRAVAVVGCVAVGGGAAIAQVPFRWTLGFAQGTSEAIIRNARGSSLNIYCPSGQLDPTPGIFLEVRGLKVMMKDELPAQIVVDDESFPFLFTGGQSRASTRIGRQTLQGLVGALSTSKAATFSVELPSRNRVETFSVKDANRVLGGSGKNAFLSGCAD